ncbi:MAG: hypothetical protein QM749_14810 [Aquabacterium sp.]
MLPQTSRHSLLAQLLRVPGIVFAINKLDAIEQGTADRLQQRQGLAQAFAEQAGIVSSRA